MSTFIEVSEEQFDVPHEYGYYEYGYYKVLLYNQHLYKWDTEKFGLKIKFPHLSPDIYFWIESDNLDFVFNFYKDRIELTVYGKNNIGMVLFYHSTNIPMNLDKIKSVIYQYNHILSEFPSFNDIMSFLDLIPESDKVSAVKNLFMGENENGFDDWKSGLELLIDYTCHINNSKPMILPMVII